MWCPSFCLGSVLSRANNFSLSVMQILWTSCPIICVLVLCDGELFLTMLIFLRRCFSLCPFSFIFYVVLVLTYMLLVVGCSLGASAT
eukprot:gene8395-5877_t